MEAKPDTGYVGDGTSVSALLQQQQQPPPQYQYQQQDQQLYPQYAPPSGGYAQQPPSQYAPGGHPGYQNPYAPQGGRLAADASYTKPAYDASASIRSSFEEKVGTSPYTVVFVIFLFIVLASSWVIGFEKRFMPRWTFSPGECPPIVIVIINALLFGSFFMLYSWTVKNKA